MAEQVLPVRLLYNECMYTPFFGHNGKNSIELTCTFRMIYIQCRYIFFNNRDRDQ